MAIFSYMDASGDASNPGQKIITVGGFVASEQRWLTFQEEWEQVLRRHNVSELHMKDFAHSRREFTDWKGKEKRRAEFIGSLTGVIRAHTLTAATSSILLDAYTFYNQHFKVAETLGNPYCLAAGYAVSSVLQWMRRRNVRDDVVFYFEKGDDGQGQLSDALRRMNIRLNVDPVLMQKRWLDSNGVWQRCIPFQAADFVSYEQTKGLTEWFYRGNDQMRMSMRQIAPKTFNQQFRFAFDETFRSLCEIFSIPRR